jgi:integrating conjugative element protein (TIGR03749 family)
MRLPSPHWLVVMAATMSSAVFAEASAARGPAADSDDERGLLGDIPGFAAAAASSPAAPASAVAAARRGSAPQASATPANQPAKRGASKATAHGRASSGRAATVVSGMRGDPDTERVVYQLAPVRIPLPIGRERTVSLPGPFALHAPEGFDALVRSQIIERTAYLKGLAPFGSVRVVAEDLVTGRQIPMDLVSVPDDGSPQRPMEVFAPVHRQEGASGNAGDPGAPPLDMVALTRHAAQSLYAPRRLIPSTPAVRQVPVNPKPVDGLYRGWRVETVPIGAWRSGDLYVTAVRFTNTGDQAVDLDLQEVRGRWLAATAQHTRLLASDPAWRTTTVYLVCDRPFDACR